MMKGQEGLQILPRGGSAGPGRALGIGEREQQKRVKGIKRFRINMQSSQLRGWKKPNKPRSVVEVAQMESFIHCLE